MENNDGNPFAFSYISPVECPVYTNIDIISHLNVEKRMQCRLSTRVDKRRVLNNFPLAAVTRFARRIGRARHRADRFLRRRDH